MLLPLTDVYIVLSNVTQGIILDKKELLFDTNLEIRLEFEQMQQFFAAAKISNRIVRENCSQLSRT